MGDSVLGIGITGLKAAQIGLAVASHNIANATTEGYHRQTAITGPQVPQETGGGFMGRGVRVETVVRAYSQFLDKALLTAETQQQYLDSYNAQIKQLDNMLADPTSGLSPALQSFFSGLQDVATNPSSVPSRQQMVSLSETLVARFTAFHNRFEEIRDGVNSEISTATNDVNKYTAELAKLNEQIIRQQGDGVRAPNDLLDQRENILAKVNEIIKTTVVNESDGSLNVFIGSGQPLVIGGRQFTLSAEYPPEDPDNLSLHLSMGNTSVRVPEDHLDGGRLSALVDFRDEALAVAQNNVGRVAVVLARTFNDQHNLGQDLNGRLGGDFFSEPTAHIVPNALNTGNSDLNIAYSNVQALTTSDYNLRYDGTNYTMTRLSDNTQTTFAAFPATVDGLTFSLASGAMATGDEYVIQPTRMGAQNIRALIANPALIAAAAPIRTESLSSNTGTATITPGVAVNTGNAAFATAGALTPPILIRFTSPTTYAVYNNTTPSAPTLLEGGLTYDPTASNAVFPTPGALDYGYRVSLTGAAATGDTFTVNINSGGVSDNRNALLLSALQTTKTLDSGTQSYQTAYSQMVADVGNRAREIQVQSKAQDALVKETTAAQQEFSGVNLDEEAANLIRFQQAYQASSRVIQMASRMFDEVLQAVR
jgi:flagellar hook-associated protein 1